MQVTLPNGVLLDDDWGFSKGLQEQAHGKGLVTLRVFKATHPDGTENYLLVDGQEPVFESESAEAIAARIDMMWADKHLP